MGRPYSITDEEAFARHWADPTLSQQDIADLHGCTQSAVGKAGQRLGLGKRPPLDTGRRRGRQPGIPNDQYALRGGEWVRDQRGVMVWVKR